MHIHRARLLRRAAYALIALAACAAAIAPVTGLGASRDAAEQWRSSIEERPLLTSSDRVIVVLSFPSLADRMRTAATPPSPAKQQQWVEEAEQSQRALVQELRAQGVEITRDLRFTRTVNGFSATLDGRALTALDQSQSVAGVYPVRAVYPASVTSDVLGETDTRAAFGEMSDGATTALDGTGVTIALLDTGVDLMHPYLAGRVLPGIDVIDGDSRAQAALNPDDASEIEQHGTRMAGLLVGLNGPGGAQGIAPGARVLPIRVLGWQPIGTGRHAVHGWADQLLAGLEHAVDPDQDGSTTDAVRIALTALVEPFAAFTDSPEARAVDGAAELGTLVIAASGNDGPAEAGSGTVGAPASAPAALAVGTADGRAELGQARVRISAAGVVVFDGVAELLSQQGVDRTTTWDLTTLEGPSLANPARERGHLATGELLTDFYATDGLSRVAASAVLVPASDGYLGEVAKNAQAAGASALIVYGDALRAGTVDLAEDRTILVAAMPREDGRSVASAIARGDAVSVSLEPAAPVTAPSAPSVAPFSSRGLSFAGVPRPDVVAPGVSVATADARPGPGQDGPYATVTGSSASAAVAAGAAALVAQARPGLSARELKSVLIGSATPLVSAEARAASSGQGGGMIDVASALETDLVVSPPVVALGVPSRGGWASEVLLEVTNIGPKPHTVSFVLVPDGADPLPLAFRVDPVSLTIEPGARESVRLVVSLGDDPATWEGWISGTILVVPLGTEPVRIPFATAFAEDPPAPLVDAARLALVEGDSSGDGLLSVLSFRVGWVGEGPEGLAIGPVSVLEVELWRDSEFLGTISRLRDLLPGRYAVGLTGRAPDGSALEPGKYRLQFVARPAIAGYGDSVTLPGPAFTVSSAQEEPALSWGGQSFGADDREAFSQWLAERGSSYAQWREGHQTAACDAFGDC